MVEEVPPAKIQKKAKPKSKTKVQEDLAQDGNNQATTPDTSVDQVGQAQPQQPGPGEARQEQAGSTSTENTQPSQFPQGFDSEQNVWSTPILCGNSTMKYITCSIDTAALSAKIEILKSRVIWALRKNPRDDEHARQQAFLRAIVDEARRDEDHSKGLWSLAYTYGLFSRLIKEECKPCRLKGLPHAVSATFRRLTSGEKMPDLEPICHWLDGASPDKRVLVEISKSQFNEGSYNVCTNGSILKAELAKLVQQKEAQSKNKKGKLPTGKKARKPSGEDTRSEASASSATSVAKDSQANKDNGDNKGTADNMDSTDKEGSQSSNQGDNRENGDDQDKEVVEVSP